MGIGLTSEDANLYESSSDFFGDTILVKILTIWRSSVALGVKIIFRSSKDVGNSQAHCYCATSLYAKKMFGILSVDNYASCFTLRNNMILFLQPLNQSYSIEPLKRVEDLHSYLYRIISLITDNSANKLQLFWS